MNKGHWIILAVVAALLAVKLVRGRAAHRQAAELIAQGARVLDVRTAGEWEGGHHPQAVHIPLDQLERRMHELGPAGTPVVVYCHSGARAAVAARRLRRAGYAPVVNAGGLGNVPR